MAYYTGKEGYGAARRLLEFGCKAVTNTCFAEQIMEHGLSEINQLEALTSTTDSTDYERFGDVSQAFEIAIYYPKLLEEVSSDRVVYRLPQWRVFKKGELAILAGNCHFSNCQKVDILLERKNDKWHLTKSPKPNEQYTMEIPCDETHSDTEEHRLIITAVTTMREQEHKYPYSLFPK